MTEQADATGYRPDPARGVYGISVAADLAGVGVQTLRLYERHGLVLPARSEGGTRRYSDDDLARLRRISALVAAGVNLAGVGRILALEDDNAELRTGNAELRGHNDSLREDNAALRGDIAQLRADNADRAGDVDSGRQGEQRRQRE